MHTCCAPCISHVRDVLCSDFDVISYFYNPNIYPMDEYRARLQELRRFSLLMDFPLHEGEYDQENWQERVRPFASLGERSERCWQCYRIRLDRSFRFARDNGITIVTTVLSISPHKDARMINQIGRELADSYNMEFLEADFKKKNGYKKSVDLSRMYGFYRQNYCGCIYSMKERAGNE